MRRTVFDCDRCGKKDIDIVISRYDESVYPENKLLEVDALAKYFAESDYLFEEVGQSFAQILSLLEEQKQWRHFCDKCFAKMVNAWAGIMTLKKRGGGVKKQPQASKKSPPSKSTQSATKGSKKKTTKKNAA